ncbi:MAG: class I SAM-dependent methyltransferase, partial [Rhodospirillales bacterium]|nr:class I SAM-dependent methyltransferase [Rhodospirillales bacterium]
ERREELLERGLKCIGVEPAAGMLDIAREKYKEFPKFSFFEGSFEALPLEDNAVDKITSTLALHWVKSLSAATEEMARVLKPSGSLDILMIAKDDGAEFKKAIVEALKRHLSFKQIMTTATLVQRATIKNVEDTFAPSFPGFDVEVTEHRGVVYGSFEDHMKWWTARSTPVLAEVSDKESFMEDLRLEMEKATTDKGIPFDSAYHHIRLTGKKS